MNFLRINVLAWLAAAGFAVAHPISMSTTTVNVRTDEVLIEMTVMLEDLVMFHSLKADANTTFSAPHLRTAAGKHEAFLLKYFSLRDDQGRQLAGKVEKRDLSAIPDAGVPQVELMKRRAIYQLRYVPEEESPSYLTFLQEFGGKKSLFPSIMQLMVLQGGVWHSKPAQLNAGMPHTVEFDWENPPKGTPQSWREIREKRDEHFKKKLGITSYTGLYSFIYLNDQEVRHEILVPLLTLETWLPLERADEEYITVAEQEAARKKISDWARSGNPVEIDGIPVKPILERLQFFGLDIADFAQDAKPRRVSAYQARVGIILTYPAKAPPNRVRLTWNTYNKTAPFLRSVVYDRDSKPTEEYFVKDQPRWEWTREGNPPAAHEFKLNNQLLPHRMSIAWLSIGLLILAPIAAVWLSSLQKEMVRKLAMGLSVGTLLLVAGVALKQTGPQLQFGGEVNDKIAITHTTTLLENVYRAYDYREESDVYDALAHSVSGPLLEELFLKVQNGLRMQEQGGAVARVKKVNVTKITPVPEASTQSIAVDCTWRVAGTVEHWGHIHTRENEYSARIHVATALPARGRITHFEVTDEKRVRFDTALRAFED